LLRAIRLALEYATRTRAVRCDLDSIRQRLGRLTAREREVMTLVVAGRLNRPVADEPGTVEKTARAHRARVMAKMEAASQAHLVRIADKSALDSAAVTRPLNGAAATILKVRPPGRIPDLRSYALDQGPLSVWLSESYSAMRTSTDTPSTPRHRTSRNGKIQAICGRCR
jgi:DNA-binding CsgD family transcriptional regulator